MLLSDYFQYSVFLLLIAGTYNLTIDAKAYKTAEMKKEKKAAGYLGWINVSLGACLFIGMWVYNTWIL